MTRRLVITIIATVLATLLVAGAATLSLAYARGRATTEADLRDQAAVLARAVTTSAPDIDDTALRQGVLRQVRQAVRAALRLEGVEFLRITEAGRRDGVLPDGVDGNDLDDDALLAGETLTGADGQLVWAAASSPAGPNAVWVAVVTRESSPGIATAARYFVIASVGTLAVGALVAVFLGRRLARPLRAASVAASAIAEGALDTRLVEPPPRQRHEVAELTRSINAMAGGLQRSRELDRQFLQSVSHDLRTPLTSIRGYAEAITDGAVEDPGHAASIIVSESARLQRLVNDLLDLARLDANSFRIDIVDVDLHGPVLDAVAALAPVFAAADIAVTTTDVAPAGTVRARADPQRVTQMVANLLDNAARHATTLVGIETLVDELAAAAIVRVTDDGPGIAATDAAGLFDRRYTVPAGGNGDAEHGAGLGLVIVGELAKAMGGSAAIVDVGPGACFELRLRRA